MASLTMILVGILLTINLVNAIDEEQFLKNEDLIRRINESPRSTWKAGHNFVKDIDPIEFLKSRTGLLEEDTDEEFEFTGADGDDVEKDKELELPKNYDLRTYKKCSTIINTIKDQSNCGSCWSLATTSALSDRFCIASNGSIQLHFSDNNILGCCTFCGYGCQGGSMDRLLGYLMKNPLVTGGPFESDVGCQPYTIAPCGFSPSDFPCKDEYAQTPKCVNRKCTNEYYEYETEQTSYKVKSFKRIQHNETMAMSEILKSGTLIVGMDVTIDFLLYESGIYQRNSFLNPFSPVMRHAVQIKGWGVENGIKYWIGANSWGTKWGENGFFRIVRGRNELNIENRMYSAFPDL